MSPKKSSQKKPETKKVKPKKGKSKKVKPKKRLPKKEKLGNKTYWAVYNILNDEINNRQLYYTFQEKREILKVIYPQFKGKKINPEDVKTVRAVVNEYFSQQNDYYNPLLLPSAFLSGIFWFELDEYLTVQLRGEADPKDLRFQINAGDLGATPIINLKSYEYFSSSVNEIVENVRNFVDNASEPEWSGIPVVRQGFTDDGKADSYFVQFTLYVNGQEVPPTENYEYAIKEIDEGTLEQRRRRRKEIAVRKKELARLRKEAERLKKVKKTALPTKKVRAEKTTAEQQKERAENINRQMMTQAELLADSERLFREGILTREEFLAERKLIMQQTQTAISKFEKGGKL
jgi:hypothetical protein